MAGALPPDAEVLHDLGQRIRRHRLAGNETQRQVADEAGVSKSTVERLEGGKTVQLTSFVRVLRALGLIANLAALVPEALDSPLDEAGRASHGQRARPSSTPSGEPWVWGDEE